MNNTFYDRDQLGAFGHIVNGDGTYRKAAADLRRLGSVVLNWTDGSGTLYNIVLAFDPPRYGAPGGLVDWAGDKLWVGIAGRGCFGFSVNQGFLSPGYAAEKLGLKGADAEKVAELISGVRRALLSSRVTGGKA